MPKSPIPCPFAHPVKAGTAVEPVNDHHFHGVCRDCGAKGPEAESYAEALTRWNARRGKDVQQ